MERYVKVKDLGAGGFGKVSLEKSKADGKKFAIKKISVDKISENDQKAAMNEVHILKELDHPNIVKYVDSFIEGSDFCIVMEYADGGNLADLICSRGTSILSEGDVLFYFSQIVSALQYLHEKKIIHRDLKPENVFLTKSKEVKLGDFGISKFYESSAQLFSTRVCTLAYCAPELFDNAKYSIEVDIWGLGCILYELCSLRPPFVAQIIATLALQICTQEPQPIPSKYSKSIRKLLSQMIEKRPKNRSSIDKISADPLLQLIYSEGIIKGIKAKNYNGAIEIPDGIKIIENGAFKDSKITSIQFPNSLIEIGDAAFSGCTLMDSIEIPANVTQIGNCAFDGCSSLSNISISENIAKISDHSFRNCSSLYSISIPNKVTEIGCGAFNNCLHLKSITLPLNIVVIGNDAFHGCSGIKSITIPQGVEHIGCFAFAGCISLSSISIPNKVQIIKDWTFYKCTSLSSVSLSESTSMIGESAFCGCSYLKSFSIPKCVKYIGKEAFRGCRSLSSMIISSKACEIGPGAFEDCSSLSSFEIK